MAEKKRGLGRGLSALIGDVGEAEKISSEGGEHAAPQELGIDLLRPGKYQPRSDFADEDLQKLAQSIGNKGILQPLVVRKMDDGGYEIIAGERRWRAAQLAKLHHVPVVVHTLSDVEALEIGIIENVQRANLNPIEEAAAYQRLIDEFSYTQEELSISLGKSRSHIANLLRLQNLPPRIQQYVSDGKISAGHARALIGYEQATHLAQEIIKKDLSVRAVETIISEQKKINQTKTSLSRSSPKSADIKAFEKSLSDDCGLKVRIKSQKGEKGVLEIHYMSLEQLDDVSRRLRRLK